MNTCLELADSESLPATKSKALFEAVEINFDNVLKNLIIDSKLNTIQYRNNLITAAFSIREISKFKKDKKFLKQIANNALKDLSVQI